MFRVRLTGLVMLVLLAPPTGAALGDSSPPKACGQPGKPPCPLQQWMRQELAGPRYERDWTRLEANLAALEAANPDPDEWTRWNKYSRRAAAAARAKRRSELDSQCRNCHKQYRRLYKKRFRLRPPPQ